ncbi:MAG: tyrosine-type recombinase/integrase [Bacteroidia bacterium]
MATIKFLIQSKNNPAGIYVRLKEGRLIDIKAKTKLIIDPKDWSNIKGKPKHLKESSLKKLNEELDKFRGGLLTHYNQSHNKLAIDSQWLKEFISPPQHVPEITNKLAEYYDYYALHKKSQLGYTTFQKLKVQKHLIQRFQQETKTEYLIKDIDASFKLRFEEFCIKEKYSPNTIAQVIKSIKTVCYHAQSNGLDIHNQLGNITVKWQKVDKVYLSPEEIKLIEKAKLDSDSLVNAKDWLLISCETGQRISDFMRFTKEKIRIEGGKPLIEFTQVKTDRIMTIPLSKKVMDILKKRKGDFPKQISDQKYNDYIKEVCKIAGLTKKVKGSRKNPETERKETGTFEKWELVTSHIGRRSFATNNYGHIPTSLLIAATGHSTEKMFLEYIGKTDTQKAMQLADYIK